MSSGGRVARPLLGIGLVLVVGSLFATMDTMIRHAGRLLPVLLLLTGRYLFQALLMAGWLALSRRDGFRAVHPHFQTARGLLLLATSAMSFFGLQHMPVPEFTAINMLHPVLVTLLAAWWLHERIVGLRWLLVAGAFAGALLVIRPGGGVFGWAVLFPLGGACFYAVFQVLTSHLAAHENPATTHFWTGFVGAVVLVPLLLASPQPALQVLGQASPTEWLLLLGIGACGTFGHLLLILALGMAPTATLMPFIYVQIGAAALLGWWVFGHLPDRWAWAGMAVIAACGAASAWLNLRAAGARGRSDSPVAADTLPE